MVNENELTIEPSLKGNTTKSERKISYRSG